MKITKPLQREVLEHFINDDGYIHVEVDVCLTDLIDNCLEGLNDLVDELILDKSAHAMLSDISYNVVGHKTTDEYIGGEITLRVIAQVSFGD